MKCVCGYEECAGIRFDRNEGYIQGFIESKFVIKYEKDINSSFYIKEEPVYICPKCGTLKIDITEEEELYNFGWDF